jgi:hypothetical protein
MSVERAREELADCVNEEVGSAQGRRNTLLRAASVKMREGGSPSEYEDTIDEVNRGFDAEVQVVHLKYLVARREVQKLFDQLETYESPYYD